ncbi:sodium channel protein para-like, partial [Ceratina calcarata]|uniref:Sodium channel protein para-like n=1 Tax=Ceratina calcarata TaxID=156304 RepID=A0AAJ7S9Q0_9HYME
MSEENGTIVVAPYYTNLGSRHSSYTSHASRVSYTSHGDLIGGIANAKPMTKESQLRIRSSRPPSVNGHFTDSNQKYHCGSYNLKYLHEIFNLSDASNSLNLFADVLVLNDIIEQAGRQTRTPEQGADDEEGPTFKDKLLAAALRCIDIFCVWDCCWLWLEFQKYVSLLVFDPFVELFITLCIVVNTLFMALDHHDMDKDMERVLKTGNYFFTATFGIEATLKLIAMSPKYYFQEGWNIFDFIIVALSLLELGLEGVQGLSVLRSFRLLRVFKLAKSWPTLNLLISIMGRTVGALGNLTFVLCIIIFIFAVMGMQLFGKNYTDNVDRFPDGDLPRWNFTDFMHSFMIVFRVLCGEWIESMWDCMLVGDVSCIPFFLATVVIGNLVVLNLFLALLLSNFGSSNLSAPTADNDTNKIAEAIDRIARFIKWVKRNFLYIAKMMRARLTNQISAQAPGEGPSNSWKEDGIDRDGDKDLADGELDAYRDKKSAKELNQLEVAIGDGMEFTIHGDLKNKLKKGKMCLNNSKVIANSINHRDYKLDNDYINNEDDTISNKSYGSHKHRAFKDESHKGSMDSLDGEEKKDASKEDLEQEEDLGEGGEERESDLGDGIIQADEDPIESDYPADCCPENCYKKFPFLAGDDDAPFWQGWANLRLKTFQLIENKYFETAVIMMILLSSMALLSLINLGAIWAGAADIPAFRSMRTLRALRPLRAVSRWEGMRVVVNALVQAIPSIFNVLLVCLIFWLIFAIMGVQLFAGKYFKCVDANKTTMSHEIIADRNACITENYTWENSPMNFDHVGKAYLCLFQVATFKGWIQIMNDAIDSREVSVCLIASSFSFRLFDESDTKSDMINWTVYFENGLSPFLRKMRYHVIHIVCVRLGRAQDNEICIRFVSIFQWRPQAIVFEIVTDKKFDMIIMLFIGLNMLTMTLDHYQQTQTFSDVLDYLNMIFIVIFTSECLMKIFALRYHYFKEPWNLFDFVVVILSILGLVLSDIIEKYFVSPTLLRVVRVAKVGRVLRLVKGAKGIRTLLFALAMSLPALFNICLLLFLVMFIFAIFGMSFFMHVKDKSGLDDVYNFKTFGQSMILLFQ